MFFSNSTNTIKLDPWFVTGFCDAESSFHLVFSKDSKSKMGWRVRAYFSLHLHIKDLSLLYTIQKFFNGVGKIYFNSSRSDALFQVYKLEELINVIIPHFDKFPLQSEKFINFLLWKKCIELMALKAHLTSSGFRDILSIRASLNKGLTDNLLNAFPDIIPIDRPVNQITDSPLHPNWITGFTEGDGTFYISSSSKNIRAFYQIGLDEKDYPVLIRIQSFFNNTGHIKEYPSNQAFYFSISRLNHLIDIIAPHFSINPLIGHKLSNYLIWLDIINIMYTKHHLTPEGWEKIIKLNETLNK